MRLEAGLVAVSSKRLRTLYAIETRPRVEEGYPLVLSLRLKDERTFQVNENNS